ncbi:MAG: WbqC family protein [Bacteroidales bacterium]|nr:WbqC family protein [Bacteroidales bacterium]
MDNKLNTSADTHMTVSHLEFFPCIKQLILFEKEKNICIDWYENFPKQTFRNRATVLSSQGLLNITVPLKNKSKAKILSRDIEISYSQNWHTQAWRTVFSCYGKSPYFIYYADKVKQILLKPHKYLMDLNLEAFDLLKQSLHLQCLLSQSTHYVENPKNDFRNAFLPKNRLADGENIVPYDQCFSEKFGFQTNLSALDLLFNLGNEAGEYLKNAER